MTQGPVFSVLFLTFEIRKVFCFTKFDLKKKNKNPWWYSGVLDLFLSFFFNYFSVALKKDSDRLDYLISNLFSSVKLLSDNGIFLIFWWFDCLRLRPIRGAAGGQLWSDAQENPPGKSIGAAASCPQASADSFWITPLCLVCTGVCKHLA